MTAAEAPMLEVRDLSVAYGVGRDAVRPIDGLSFTLRQREIVGLIGEAGSGKSTAALALMGLARPPGHIVGGQVAFEGRDLLAMDDEALRRIRGRDIGIIVQNPRGALNPMLKVGRQIGNAYRAHNKATRGDGKLRAIDMLRMVGINDPERRVDAYAHELSGGMAQRALIAMALSSMPKLLIADEPTSGLDVTIQAQFLDQMWQTVQETGSAMFLVAQELGILANYCDRVLVLQNGHIAEDAPVRQFFSAPQQPYSREILRLEQDTAEGGITSGATVKADAEPLVRINGLVKNFPIKGSSKVVQAVHDVDLAIAPGETLGLVGESGSGKTTVGRCLVHLTEPTEGAIRFGEQTLSGLSAAALRQMRAKLQIVFQDPYDSLNPRWTIRRILREPLDLHTDLSRGEKDSRSRELLEMVGVDPGLIDRRPQGLGAGMLQRLNIARAIATNPSFIVLDEPTSVLSPRAVVGLVDLLRRLQRDLGLSYLFISHDLTTVRYLCHRVAVMYLGQIVEKGSVDQVFNDPKHPYSKALLAAHLFPDPGQRRVDRPDRRELQGEIPSPIDLPKGCYLASRCPSAKPECQAQPQELTILPDGRSIRCWRVATGDLADQEGLQHAV
ncbi:MAG: ABC transporter ATP-binding protein [Pseudomonadota bacterium]